MFLKVTKIDGEVKRCELRKHLRYGRGKPIPYEKAMELTKGLKPITMVRIGDFEFYTWEVPA